MTDVHVLGLLRVHNGGAELKECLDSLVGLCDEICAIDDRSRDETSRILEQHSLVTNTIRARQTLSDESWLIDERTGFELLYRVADFIRPDWVLGFDHDQVVERPSAIRVVLAAAPEDVAGLEGTIVSLWRDPDYPAMVPLMGSGRTRRCLLWRYAPDLRPGSKPIHNGHAPENLLSHGRRWFSSEVVVRHSGWDTLAARVAKARLYLELDPTSTWNWNVDYDRGLLFGYSLDELDQLLKDYRDRYDVMVTRDSEQTK